MIRDKLPSSHDFERAVGRGASTEEVAQKLGIRKDQARKGLAALRGLKILIEPSKDHWRPMPKDEEAGRG